MKISAKTIAIGISTLVVVGGSIAYYFLTNDSPETLGWMNSSWLYRKSITVPNPGSTLTNEDVLIEVNTASLVTAGKLQSDCDDLRFVDSDDNTYLKYWVEGGCNTSTTQIWIQIPSLPNGGKSVYMYYGNNSAINAEESWAGKFTLLSSGTDCGTSWTRNIDFDGYYPRGAASSGGTGGLSSHGHDSFSGSTNGYAGIFQTESGATSASSNYHGHGGVLITVNSKTVLPPYKDMLFCQNNNLKIDANMVSIFTTTIPTGWTSFSSLTGFFPRGASAYGGTGGTSTHNHSTGSDTTSGPSGTVSAGGAGCNAGSSSHTHTVATSTTSTENNTPPYIEVIYASANSSTTGVAGMVSIVDIIPPLGWEHLSDLDDKFPLGASTYGTTGGGNTHNHTYSNSAGSGSPSVSVACSGTGTYVGTVGAHTVSFSTSYVSNLPPYLNTIFAKRKTSFTTSIGEEETKNTTPDAPSSLLTEGQTNPSRISDLTPEFSAIFSDADTSDTGNYYQIQVNTKSDFTGTSMWDSTKTAFNPVITNNTRSSDISYTGNTLQLGTIYYWRIKFWDNNDAESSWSSIANFTMNTTPTAPTALLTEGSTNPNGIADTTPEFSAIFNDPDIGDTGVSYQIEVNTASDFLGTSMWDSTLTSMTSTAIGARSPDISYAGTTLSHNGTMYYWRIKFADASGLTSPWSAIGSFVMDGGPFAPTELLTDGQTNPVRILSLTPSFSAIYNDPNGDSASAYQIEVNTNNTFTGTVMWNSTKTSTSVTDNTRSSYYTYAGIALNNTNTTYYWRIKFWDAEDYEGEWSATAQFSSLQTSFQIEGLKIEGIKIN